PCTSTTSSATITRATPPSIRPGWCRWVRNSRSDPRPAVPAARACARPAALPCVRRSSATPAPVAAARSIAGTWRGARHPGPRVAGDVRAPWTGNKRGSSPKSGEGRPDLQEEVGVVPVAVGYPLDDLDLVVD